MLPNSALLADADADAADSSVQNLIGRRVGNYVLERPLAQGGMGSVFVAKHPHLGREVAIKFLSRQVSASEEHAQRFLSEARVTASLKHPHIVDIFDFGELDGRLYYVMELLRGESLRTHMRSQGRFTADELRPFMEQMCSALHAAHGAGIVHRDLKPGNVFVVERSPVRVKLLDFGVAKLMETGDAQTRHGQVLGTPTHMAPEQALGDVHRISPRTDLYSLGVIAYEMLTGTPVFRHESELMLLVMHIRDPIVPIRQLVPEVHQEVAAVIESCLTKDPNARPASARELSERFVAALSRAAVLPKAAPPVRVVSEASEQPATSSDGNAETVAKSLAARALLGHDRTLPEAKPAPIADAPPRPQRPAALVVVATPERPDATVHTLPADAPPPPPSSARSVAEPAAATDARAVDGTAQPAAPAVVAAEPEPAATGALNQTGTATLNKLLLRLQRQGDFPAFAQAVGEVTKKADPNSAYSASQLGESILKDYALTAKLLRVVNSMYANRFGGKIYSVQHAIVLLGFERVRSLALSISLFKGSRKAQPSRHVSESAINSIVSGEIARTLAGNARLNDDEALICGMFRDLGRHLVIVYLPELYEQVAELVSSQHLSWRAASERVLGTSFARIGFAIAQNWRLPPRILNAISAPPNNGAALTRVEDRLSALAEFASEVCELVSNEPPATRERAINTLLARHKNLLTLDAEAILEVLASVRHALHERYSKLLGLDVKASRFLANLAEPQADETAAAADSTTASGTERSEAIEPAAAPVQDVATPALEKPVEAKPVVARLELARAVPAKAAAPTHDRVSDAELELCIQRLQSALVRGGSADALLSQALRVLSEQLSVSRLLVLTANSTRDELIVRFGLREDIDGLARELRFPLKTARGPANLFASAYHSGRDVVVSDAFAPRTSAPVPVRYFEALGSPAFAVYACVGKGLLPCLLLVEVDSAEDLPSSERVARIAKLRPIVAQACARR